MGLHALFFGLIFLCNPNIMVFDIIPDFIGYAFMIYGLMKLRDLSPEIGIAQRGFVRLMLISLSKLVLSAVFLRNLDGGYLMVLTFVYAIAESVIGISVFSHFFKGLFYIGSRYDNDGMVRALSPFQHLTYIMILVNSIFCFLPQSVFLWLDENEGYVLGPYQLPLYILAFLAGAIVGIRWLAVMLRFRKITLSDQGFCDRIAQDYNSRIAPNTDLFLSRRLRTGLLYLASGLALLYDFYFDGINALPDFLGAALLITGFALLIPHCPYAKAGVILSSGYGALSAVAFVFSTLLARRYYDASLAVSPKAYREFLVSAVLSAAEGLFSLVLLAAVTLTLLYVIRTYTVHTLTGELESVRLRDESIRRGFYMRTSLFALCGVLALCSAVANYICLYFFPEYWMIHLIPSILWLATVISLFSALREYINNRYS